MTKPRAWKRNLMEDEGGYIIWEEIERVLDRLEGRDYALIRALAYSGRRVGELNLLRPLDISIDTSKIWWWIEKKRLEKKPRVPIPIDTQTYYKILGYIDSLNVMPEDFTFFTRGHQDKPITPRQIERIVRKIAEKYKLRTVSGRFAYPHSFRHSYAIHVVQTDPTTRSLKILQYLLQHENIETTMYYLNFTETHISQFVEEIFNPEAAKKQLEEKEVSKHLDKIL